MLAILWSSLKQVNNYYHGRKVSNYKSLHKENVIYSYKCERTVMSKTWSYKVRWSLEVVMRSSSVANETVKHYGVPVNKAKRLRTGWTIILLVEMLSFVCYKPDMCKYKPAYKKSQGHPTRI